MIEIIKAGSTREYEVKSRIISCHRCDTVFSYQWDDIRPAGFYEDMTSVLPVFSRREHVLCPVCSHVIEVEPWCGRIYHRVKQKNCTYYEDTERSPT